MYHQVRFFLGRVYVFPQHYCAVSVSSPVVVSMAMSPVRASRALSMMMAVPMPTARATVLVLLLHLLHPLPIAPHNVPNMPDTIEVHLQLINLP